VTPVGGVPLPLSGTGPLIDVHAHFYQPGSSRANGDALNRSRLQAGDQVGVTWHVGSILGTWGATSPTYFQSPTDTVAGNNAMLATVEAEPNRVRAWAAVNPNDGEFALEELERCRRRMLGRHLRTFDAPERVAHWMQALALEDCPPNEGVELLLAVDTRSVNRRLRELFSAPCAWSVVEPIAGAVA
jgi:hypothetical protein